MSVRHLIQETAGLINAARSVAPIVAVLSEDEPRDGVTTVSCALAAQLVGMRRSVAVVDCDFTDPQLHERLTQPLGLGLAAVLAGDSRIDHVFNYSTVGDDTFLTVTAGEHHVRRAPLLSAPTAAHAVQRLSELSEIVLLNGAPLTTQAGRDLVALVDAVVLVVSAGAPLGPDKRPAILRGSRPYVAARVADPGAVLRPRDLTSSRGDVPADQKLLPNVVPARRSTDRSPRSTGRTEPVPAGRGAPGNRRQGGDSSGLMTRRRRVGSSALAAGSQVDTESSGSNLPAIFVEGDKLPGFVQPVEPPVPDDAEVQPPRKRRFLRSSRGKYLD